MSASHPKATEMLRDNEVTQCANNGRERMQQQASVRSRSHSITQSGQETKGQFESVVRFELIRGRM
jgi:hypothetical protein